MYSAKGQHTAESETFNPSKFQNYTIYPRYKFFKFIIKVKLCPGKYKSAHVHRF